MTAKLTPQGSLLIGLAAAVFLGACSAGPNRNLIAKYDEMVRGLGLTPVYPPREELQVGDVFFVSYDARRPNDRSQSFGVWVGSLDSVRHDANAYTRSRINFNDTGTNNNAFKTRTTQSDFSGGRVSVNADGRTSLPLVTFPTISGAATTAGALGSFGFLRSFGLGFGTAETVSIDFADTRAFGVPIGAVRSRNTFKNEYQSKICSHANRTLSAAMQMAAAREIDPPKICENGRKCHYTVVTRTYMTREIDYRYTSAQIARIAASRARGELGSDPTTQPATSNVDLNITIGDNTSAEDLAKLAAALQPSVTNPNTKKEFDGLSFTGFQGNTMTFKRTLQKPVTIAYDGLNYAIGESEMSCGITIVERN